MELEIICYRAGGGESKENTIRAIENCINVNSNWRVEIDLQLSKDHEVVLLHDDNLIRTHGLDLSLKDISYKSILNELDKNSQDPLPTLEEVFLAFQNTRWVLDLHSTNPSIVDRVISLIEKYNLESNVVIVSEHDHIIKLLRVKRSTWPHASPTNESKKLIFWHKLGFNKFHKSKATILAIPKRVGRIPILSQSLIQTMKNQNKQVWIFGDDLRQIEKRRALNLPISSQRYTIQELKQYDQMGISAVFTDFPSHIKECLQGV